MGLYDALPSAKDEQRGEGEALAKKEGWVGTGLFAPANLAAKRAGEQVQTAKSDLGAVAARLYVCLLNGNALLLSNLNTFLVAVSVPQPRWRRRPCCVLAAPRGAGAGARARRLWQWAGAAAAGGAEQRAAATHCWRQQLGRMAPSL